ncbi:MAG TPA: hypothetical protein VGP72_32195 [Planctomycetota bacterium]|jgi:hypothetical protein
MHITYCKVCGVRVELQTAEEGEPTCPDCLAGKTRRPARRGDSALLRRRTTSRMLKTIKPDGK